MPAPENTVTSAPEPKPEQTRQQPPRELTQTDHLNKRLLVSLFKSIDEGGEESISKMMEPDDSPDKIEDKEWED